MKKLPWILAAAFVGSALTAPAMADGIGLSLNIGEPGFFGRIELGDAPRPELYSTQPVWIERPRGAPMPPPVYLHVRPGQERHWRRYCREYNACGQPVLFVRDSWYQRSYVPHYRERYGHGHDEHRDDHHDNGDRHDDHRDDHDRPRY